MNGTTSRNYELETQDFVSEKRVDARDALSVVENLLIYYKTSSVTCAKYDSTVQV